MTMPFGKWRGYPLSAVPLDYLYWLYEEPWVKPALRRAVRDQLSGYSSSGSGYERQSEPPSPPLPSDVMLLHIAPEFAPLAAQLLELGYKALAKRLHPDIGGDKRQMQQLNELMSTVRYQLAGGLQ